MWVPGAAPFLVVTLLLSARLLSGSVRVRAV
jgi:hypothetical protein